MKVAAATRNRPWRTARIDKRTEAPAAFLFSSPPAHGNEEIAAAAQRGNDMRINMQRVRLSRFLIKRTAASG